MTLPDALIDVSELTKSYGQTTTVDHVTFQVARGSVFGLIGPNGAGKSTLIRMLIGMLPSTSGHARVLGMNVSTHRDQICRRIGYVPEHQTIYRWMTVGEVISFCRAFRDNWQDRLCESLLNQFELELSKKVMHLSKGMQTKLALLLALAYEPELLILDEPTTGLDPIIRDEFLEPVLNAVCKRGCTVLFSSHTIEDVERLADHVGILLRGRLIVDAPVAELLGTTRRLRATLPDGCLPKVIPPGTVWQSIDRREWQLTVTNFSDDTARELKVANDVSDLQVNEVSLNSLFKDYVKGSKVTS